MIRKRLQALGCRSHLAALVMLPLIGGCGGDSAGPDPGNIDTIVYSRDIQPVLAQNCNTAACHNEIDKASGLDLTSHRALAAGSRFGAMIVPFFADRSHFWLHLSGAIEPRMPLARDPLSQPTLDFLARWINEGAVDDFGKPMYSDVTRKAFVACQGENTVAVVDMDTGLAVRHIEVDQPHSVYVDQITRRLYVSRLETASDNIQVFDADTYQLITTGRAGTFPALMAVVRPPGSPPQLWVTNFDTADPLRDHKVRVLDPTTLAEITSFRFASAIQPHGLAVSSDQRRVYICNIASGSVTIFGTDGAAPGPWVVDGPILMPNAGTTAYQPQQCVLSKDENYLFVSAQNTDDVHVLDLTVSPPAFLPGAVTTVGDGPWHITLAPGGSELWVADWKSSEVTVLDVSDPTSPAVKATLSPANPFDTGRQALQRPIGIQFTPDGTRVYVTSANDDGSGTGHHPAPDGEKNPGNVAVFDAAPPYAVLSVAEVPNFARFVSFLP